jgi:hypothetical protein
MRAGVVRAEGLKVTSVAAADLILIQQQQSNGQYLPREVAYSNFISGGVSLTPNSVVLTNGAGDLTTNAGLTFANSTLTFSPSIATINSLTAGVAANVAGTQAAATLLPSTINFVTAAGAGYSVKLPPAQVGLAVTVYPTNNNIQIYGSGSDTINALTANVGTNQFAETFVTYYCWQAGLWYSNAQTLQVGSNGNTGFLVLYPPTVNNGSLLIEATNNAGNFQSIITVGSIGQATDYIFPDPGVGSANVILSAGNQVITGTTQINTLHLGAAGTAGTITIFPSLFSNGTFIIDATNNVNNFASTLTNGVIGQATVYTLPDPGTATANIVLDHGTQTIAGVKTFSSIPIGTAQAIQVYLSPITAQAGAVSVIFQAPFNGTVTSVAVAVSGAFTATNITVTPSVYHSGSPTAITGGAVTVNTAGSGVASNATSTPSAANTFLSGDTVTATVTGGVGAVNGVITLYVTRTS